MVSFFLAALSVNGRRVSGCTENDIDTVKCRGGQKPVETCGKKQKEQNDDGGTPCGAEAFGLSELAKQDGQTEQSKRKCENEGDVVKPVVEYLCVGQNRTEKRDRLCKEIYGGSQPSGKQMPF